MFSNTARMKSVVLLLVMVPVLTTGCTNQRNNQNNQVKTQEVRMQQAPNQMPQNVDNRIRIAQQAADKITQIPGVLKANVLVTQKNAYVAATLDTNQGQLTPGIESRIAQQVKETDPTIKNVYVSTNPDFVEHVNRYVSDVAQGRPVSGFFKEFSDMVQRIFPNAQS
ncbi:YhcN/YlaJ family sporulation lipoprotein [Paenibacillus humicus]|uniref:YhcN/YlaJ family sporulation lipoprotein n=1 Tax=Paenibacillus humicus TaxID=412861 RepID=UPI003D290A26